MAADNRALSAAPLLTPLQAAAAAAREAAQAAARQQLQQQAEAAARSYMAAWRIARAWQAYRRSASHANKVAAVVVLQTAVRGVAARRLAGQLKRHRELLLALRDAERSGSYHAVQSAASAAAEAGVLVVLGPRTFATAATWS